MAGAFAPAIAAAVLVLVGLSETPVSDKTKGAAHHAGRVPRVIPATSVAVVPVGTGAATAALPETPALRHQLAAKLGARGAPRRTRRC